MRLEANKKFHLELDRIRFLFHSTVYAFNTAVESIDSGDLDKNLDKSKRLSIIKNEEEKFLLSKNKLKAKYQKRLPKEIAGVLLIRAISTLEVYLISQVKELFLARRDLFHSDETISLARGELLHASNISELWEKLINKELRKLQNQSLSDKSKYFRKYLKINFSESAEYPFPLEHIHDVRHLIVHKLGITDSQYRKKYKSDVKMITINESFLEDSILSIRKFGEFIFDKSDELARCKSNHETDSYYIVVKVLRFQVLNVFDKSYSYIDGDNFIYCSDFISNITEIDKNTFKIELTGSLKYLNSYVRLLKRLQRGHSIVIEESDYQFVEMENRDPGRKLSVKEIREIAKGLPLQPWDKGIHKRIAIDLGTSNNEASKAIECILNDPDLYSLVGLIEKYK